MRLWKGVKKRKALKYMKQAYGEAYRCYLAGINPGDLVGTLRQDCDGYNHVVKRVDVWKVPVGRKGYVVVDVSFVRDSKCGSHEVWFCPCQGYPLPAWKAQDVNDYVQGFSTDKGFIERWHGIDSMNPDDYDDEVIIKALRRYHNALALSENDQATLPFCNHDGTYNGWEELDLHEDCTR